MSMHYFLKKNETLYSIRTQIHILFWILVSVQIIFLASIEAKSWSTYTSNHFKFILHEDHADQAQHIAEQSEAAYLQLSHVYQERPKSKILIVVDHRTNASNGSATHFPYPHIVIYPVLPTAYSTIGEYHQWVYELVLHELVHYFTFYPTHGVYKPLQWIFGNLFAPNFILLPSWFHEGLAVSLETHLTSGGRLRSENYKEMYKLLALDLKSGKENLARINERYIPSYPYGQRPYFFGSLLLNESTKSKTPKNVNDLIQDFSKALPPYNLYSSVKRNFGNSFRSVRKNLLQAPDRKINPEDFKFKGHSPMWLDSKSFLTVHQNKDLMTQIFKNSTEDQKSKLVFETLGSEKIHLSKDKKLIVYDQMMGHERLFNTTDLYLYDLTTKKRKRLTYGAKLREAALSNDNSKIVAVQTDLSNTKLIEFDINRPKLIRVLYSPKTPETRISSPLYYSSSKIIFIEKEPAHTSKVKILDLKDNKIKILDFSNSFEKIFGIDAANGKVLLHAKEPNKPRQHYLLDKDYKSEQITYDPIGTRSASLFKDQLLISRITNKDYKTAHFKNHNAIDRNQKLFDDKIILSEGLLLGPKDIPKTELVKKKYSALNYMLPQYWYPFITPNYGGFSGQYSWSVSTGSSDPLGLNAYAISLRQDTISDRLSGGINYFHTNKKFIWGLSLNQVESPLTEQFSRTFKLLGLSARYDFGHQRYLGHAITLGLTYIDASLTIPPDTQQIKSAGPQITYEYNSLIQQPSRIAPSKGIFTSVNLAHYLEQNDFFSYNSAEAYFETYFSGILLPEMTSLKVFSKALASDQFLPTVFTPVNLSGYFTTSRQQNSFVIRGYPSGIFQARNTAYTFGLEYYFPILNLFDGPESLPLFFRRLYGSVVADIGSFDGLIYDFNAQDFVNHEYTKLYSGVGLELHTELTMGHYIPLKLSVGYYTPIQKINGIENAQVFLNLTTPMLP